MIRELALKLAFAAGAFFAGMFLISCAWVVFVMVPVMAITESQCLKRGMPNLSVTVFLERYCTTIDGSVTISVEQLKEK